MATTLTTRQVAERLGIHVNTVHHWVRREVLHPIRLYEGANYRFRARDVEELAERLGIEPEQEAS